MESRHFPYQHPRFGTVNKPAKPEMWKNTVYYWWWEYLRRNTHYKATCLKNGSGRCSRLYEDFGDVHSTDFKSWWKERGVPLFSEPPKDKQFSQVKSQIAQEDLDNPNLLFVQVPLNLPVRLLKQRFDTLLKKYHQGKRGIRYARDSHAKYPVIGQPNINSLMTTLQVYDYRQLHPEMTLWQVGMILRQFKDFDPNKLKGKYDGYEQKNIMTATVSRYLKKAELMITNVGHGRFPDTTDHEKVTEKS